MTLKFNPFTNKLDITGSASSGGGDVSGPGSSTDNAVVRWSGTTGTLVQNSVVTISDTGDIIANSIDLTIPVSVADGGTDISSYTTGDILYASGAGTLTKLAIGSASDVLTVTGGLPSWQPSIGGGTVTSVSGTLNRVTSTGGATPVIDISASYVGQSSITTLGTITTGVWTGTDIALADGGTGASLTASNGGIFYSTAGAGAILSGTATANQVLLSGASTTPAWSTATYPSTTTVNQILYSSATNVVSGLATAIDGVLITSHTGVPSILANSGTAGWVLTANSGAPPSWQAGGGGASPLTTKGDLYTYSTVDARLPVGANGTILTADSTATTGNKWTTATYPNTATTGDLLYASGSNVIAGLAIGATNQVPVVSSGVPVWGDNWRRLVNLSKQTASNSASISFTSFINAVYSEYFITIRGLTVQTDATSLYMTFSTDNGSTYISSNYYYGVAYIASNAATGVAGGSQTAAQFLLSDAYKSTAGYNANVEIELFNLGSSTLFPCYGVKTIQSLSNNDRNVQEWGTGGFGSTTNVNAIKIAMSSGNLVSGVFTLYGVITP